MLINVYCDLWRKIFLYIYVHKIRKENVTLCISPLTRLNILQHIRNVTGSYTYTCNESKKPQNKNLNRYRDVAPYDHSRVILKKGVCDYIHANYIPVSILLL